MEDGGLSIEFYEAEEVSAELRQQGKAVFIGAGSDEYREARNEELEFGEMTKEQWLSEQFDKTTANAHWLVLKKEEKNEQLNVGFAQLTIHEDFIFVEQMVLIPDSFTRRKLIYEEIRNRYPTRSACGVIRKVNSHLLNVYLKLGAVQTAANWPGYHPDRYIGVEFAPLAQSKLKRELNDHEKFHFQKMFLQFYSYFYRELTINCPMNALKKVIEQALTPELGKCFAVLKKNQSDYLAFVVFVVNESEIELVQTTSDGSLRNFLYIHILLDFIQGYLRNTNKPIVGAVRRTNLVSIYFYKAMGAILKEDQAKVKQLCSSYGNSSDYQLLCLLPNAVPNLSSSLLRTMKKLEQNFSFSTMLSTISKQSCNVSTNVVKEAILESKTVLTDEQLELCKAVFKMNYGLEETRKDYDMIDEPKLIEDARCVVSVWEESSIKDEGDLERVKLSLKKFSDVAVPILVNNQPVYSFYPLNQSAEIFCGQPQGPVGTAFIISKRHLLTASHVVREGPCSNNLANRRYVIGFRASGNQSDIGISVDKSLFKSIQQIELSYDFPRKYVFDGKVIYYSRWDDSKENPRKHDYAIVQLDRDLPVGEICSEAKLQAEPLPTTFTEPLETHMFGHGQGLLLKYSTTQPRQVFEPRYNSRPNDVLDTIDLPLTSYAGNSGSPVFNSKTHEVIGILLGGNPDYRGYDESFQAVPNVYNITTNEKLPKKLEYCQLIHSIADNVWDQIKQNQPAPCLPFCTFALAVFQFPWYFLRCFGQTYRTCKETITRILLSCVSHLLWPFPIS